MIKIIFLFSCIQYIFGNKTSQHELTLPNENINFQLVADNTFESCAFENYTKQIDEIELKITNTVKDFEKNMKINKIKINDYCEASNKEQLIEILREDFITIENIMNRQNDHLESIKTMTNNSYLHGLYTTKYIDPLTNLMNKKKKEWELHKTLFIIFLQNDVLSLNAGQILFASDIFKLDENDSVNAIKIFKKYGTLSDRYALLKMYEVYNLDWCHDFLTTYISLFKKIIEL